ncbi:hypothetical protein MRX96_016128 [Rhipicephalus microplus]
MPATLDVLRQARMAAKCVALCVFTGDLLASHNVYSARGDSHWPPRCAAGFLRSQRRLAPRGPAQRLGAPPLSGTAASVSAPHDGRGEIEPTLRPTRSLSSPRPPCRRL